MATLHGKRRSVATLLRWVLTSCPEVTIHLAGVCCGWNAISERVAKVSAAEPHITRALWHWHLGNILSSASHWDVFVAPGRAMIWDHRVEADAAGSGSTAWAIALNVHRHRQ